MKERERERNGRENRMLNISSPVHFTPLKKMGCAGIIIALDQRRVGVKERDEGEKLCKRWRAMNKRQSLRFILSPLCGLYLQRALGPARCAPVTPDKLRQTDANDIRKDAFKIYF